jgi:Protein of unknown function (DUF2795)
MASQNEALEEVARALMGVTFPADKDDLAELVQRTHPDDDAIKLLAQLPDRKYTSMAEIEEGLAEATRTWPSSRSQDGRTAERSTSRDPSSERLEKVLPAPPDQLEAVRKNQRSVESALDPRGLPEPEHYGKRSGARPTEERRSPRRDRVD